MRGLKISLKKYFYFTLICALLLIFGFNLRERDAWSWKSATSHQQLDAETPEPGYIDPGTNKEDNSYGAYSEETTSHGAATPPRKGHHDITTSHAPAMGTNNELVYELENEVARDSLRRRWFFKKGVYYPEAAKIIPSKHHRKGENKTRPRKVRLFPDEDPHSDRIVNQLMYVPRNYKKIRRSGKLKTILVYNGLGPWNVKQGREVFQRLKCPVDTCEITSNRDRATTADMILYKDHYIPTFIRKPDNPNQVTMLYYLECPYHTQNVKSASAINWTATYRRDSDIVAPYEKWVYYDPGVYQLDQDRNYALNKTKKVAWFVSNCGARNNRLQYAHELQKHIQVDIYGACGNYKCPRANADKCFEILDNDYKFYLAFENSNCKDYITEKLFVNALQHNVLPIVMGARPEDYETSAPFRSYIHVDEFASPQELANYLHLLNSNDALYNSYFKWKGTGEFINTFFWCRVCAALHDEAAIRRKPRWYTDVNDWWRGPGVCTGGSWRNYKARKDVISDD